MKTSDVSGHNSREGREEARPSPENKIPLGVWELLQLCWQPSKVNNKVKKKILKNQRMVRAFKNQPKGFKVWLKRVGEEAFYPFSKACPLLRVKYMKVL